MKAVPITLREANDFVKNYHRHNQPVVGSKFAIGAEMDGKLVGVAIAGRPVARLLDNGKTLEIVRVCTDGTRNVNSFLYGRVKQIGLLMGYEKIITYTLKSESGSSLRAVGAILEQEIKGQGWNRPNRIRIEQKVYLQEKIRWALI